jgi:hypothetical protein
LEFDVTMINGVPASANGAYVRFQNNIQSIFSRVRLLYGSTPLEDIINYNVIVRNLTEWTATAGNVLDQTSISEGIGGVAFGAVGTTGLTYGLKNLRQAYIQGIDNTAQGSVAGLGAVPNATTVGGLTTSTRRYQVQLALGLFTQSKLIPTKFMASQLAIEITLAAETSCMFAPSTSGWTTSPTYSLSNVNLIPEILEFDASYDASFIRVA